MGSKGIRGKAKSNCIQTHTHAYSQSRPIDYEGRNVNGSFKMFPVHQYAFECHILPNELSSQSLILERLIIIEILAPSTVVLRANLMALQNVVLNCMSKALNRSMANPHLFPLQICPFTNDNQDLFIFDSTDSTFPLIL